MSLESVYEKALTHIVLPKSNGHFRVVNNERGIIYDVVLRGSIRQCNCEHGFMKKSPCCSHLLAAARLAISEKGYRVVEVVRQDDKPEGKHFKINRNTFLIVERIPELVL